MAIFWNFGGELENETDPDQIKNRVLGLANSIFFMCIAQLALYEFATVMEFQKERAVFIREKTGNQYGTLSYYISKLIIELPLLLALPLLENAITFFGINYRSG